MKKAPKSLSDLRTKAKEKEVEETAAMEKEEEESEEKSEKPMPRTKEAKADVEDLDFSKSDLDEMGETLLRAEEIKKDQKVYILVQKHMAKKAQAISSLDDLRRKASALELEA